MNIEVEAENTAPAGWYSHPSMADTQRYWDGARWTDHIAPWLPSRAVVHAVPPAGPTLGDGVVVVGYLTAILIPVIGFIIGIVAMAKGRAGNGVVILLLSVVAFIWWAAALSPEPTTSYYGY